MHVGDIPNIFSIMSTDNMRRLSDNIIKNTEMQISSMFNHGYDHAQERAGFLSQLRKRDDITTKLIETTLNRIFIPDAIISITTKEQLLQGVPKRMEEIILTDPNIRQSFFDGELYGFGLEPETVPTRDPWKHLLYNGATGTQSGKGIMIRTSDDPIHTIEDLQAIDDTRRFIKSVFDEGYDPTDFPNRRGKIE